jgi:ATP-dependent DNA helicase PIF1
MTQDKALEILKTGVNVFLTGEPGSGKTYTINQFTKWLRSQGKTYAVTASTGIAATHINGKTIHSWSGMGIKEKVTDADIAAILQKEYAVEQMDRCDVLIIDEVSMLSGSAIDNVDRILRAIKFTSFTGEAFGGLQVVFVGDFFQLPPISKPGKEPGLFAFESDAWNEAKLSVCYLTEQHRQEDQEFLEILTAMRNGKMTDAHTKRLLQCRNGKKPKTKLYTHNMEVDAINMAELLKLPGKAETFAMESGGLQFLVDTLKKNCLSPQSLVLKKGAVVMFTKNNFEERYVNGTLGVIVDFASNGMPIVETHDGLRITARYAEWSIDNMKGWISQIPLRLAWAMTVHKSQGMSYDEAAMDLSKCFEYGQGYVALSRVRSLKGLYLEGMNERALEMHPKVVSQDALFREQSDLLDNKN